MNILIAEDDEEAAGRLSRQLTAAGHDTAIAATGPAALEALMTGAYDVAILDRMLPEQDGLSVAGAARAARVNTHVLMVTALGSIADRVAGLEGGADDYLTKPFAMVELLARVNALQRRRQQDAEQHRLTAGELEVDVTLREVRCAGRPVPLQPREFRLLVELIRARGQVMTRGMLLQRVWGFNFEPRTNLVETHISRLRTKLAMAGACDVIQTVRGAGYMLQADD